MKNTAHRPSSTAMRLPRAIQPLGHAHPPEDAMPSAAVPSAIMQGFTLVELLVVVVLISILAAIAIPSYSSYILRGRLTQAFSTLSDYNAKMEQYFQDNRNYGTTQCADNGPPSWNTSPGTNTFGANNTNTNTSYFTYSCSGTGTPVTGYTIKATGVGSVAGYVYAIDNNGNRTTLQFNNQPNPPATSIAPIATCWYIRNGSCN